MKRTPIKRKRALTRRARLRPISPKRKRTDTPRDRAWMDAVKQLPCLAIGLVEYATRPYFVNAWATECDGPIDPHHAGWNHSKGEGKGTAIKAKDDSCVPLCRRHHQCAETLAGPFRGWTKQQRREWMDEAIAKTRAAVEAMTSNAHDGHGARRTGGLVSR